MVDWGGLSTKELSQDVKDAILDVLGVRLIAASQTNPLATIEDVLGLGGGGGGGGPAGAGSQLEHASITKVDSDFSTTSLVAVDVTGATLAFELPVGQTVILVASATMQSPSGVGNDAVLGIDIDGAQFFEGTDREDHASGVEHHRIASVVVPRATISGPHTAKVILKSVTGTPAAQLKVGADNPVRLTAIWARSSPTRATILKAPTAADTSGPFGTTSATFVPVPGTAIAFQLAQAQDVVFLVQATARLLGAAANKGHIGIKVDGVDHETGTIDHLAFSIHSDNHGGHLSLPLLPGPHTAEVVIRDDAGAAPPFELANDVDAPTRLTAFFSEPIFGVGSLTVKEGLSVAPISTVSTAFVPVPATAVAITLDQPQEVLLVAQATGERVLAPAGSTHVELGIRITDVSGPTVTDVPGSQWFADNLAAGTHLTGLRGGLVAVARITLPAGAHSAEMIMRTPTGVAAPCVLLTGARLQATHTKAESFPKSLGFFKASAIRTSNFGFSGTDEVPMVDLTFTLSQSQEVWLKAHSGGLAANVLFGQPGASIRHIEDPGGADIITDYLLGAAFDSDGGDFVAGGASASGGVLVTLAAGTHRIVLIAHSSTATIRAPMQIMAIAQEPI
jgi:hypothetical protein